MSLKEEKYCSVCGAEKKRYNEEPAGFSPKTGKPLTTYYWKCSANPCHEGHESDGSFYHKRSWKFWEEQSMAHRCIFCNYEMIMQQE